MPETVARAENREVDTDQLFDLRENPMLAREMPTLATVLDPQEILLHLQGALIAHPARASIENCEAMQAAYLPEFRSCLVRYRLDVRGSGSEHDGQVLVTVRAFRSRDAAELYFRERLAPLVERARGLPGIEPFVRHAGILDDLNSTAEVFPVDGELPTLVDAANSSRVGAMVGRVIAETLDDEFSVGQCRVSAGHYGRQNRCVLRYDVEARVIGSDQPQRRFAYGKVAVDDRGAAAADAIASLRDLSRRGGQVEFNLPSSAVFDPDLRLLVLDVVPGTRQISRLLRALLREDGRAVDVEQTLSSCIRDAARTAAWLHSSGVSVGAVRTVDDEVSELASELEPLRVIAPELGGTLACRLRTIEADLHSTSAGEPTFSHGDFSHTQLLFDAGQCGVVDFDTVCQAEPSLDLGHFLAYLRLAVAKAGKAPTQRTTQLAEGLCEQFLDSYAAASDPRSTGPHVRARVHGFEALSLLRLAIHSWRKFKPRRVARALTLLEEGSPWLKSKTA